MSDGHYSLSENACEPPNDGSGSVLLRPGVTSVFECLCHRHRRLVLLLLKRGDVETKADVIGEEDRGTEGMEIALEHRHLPKLAQAGYVEWDRDTGEISRGELFHEIEAFLDVIERHPHQLPAEWQ